jgi:hypothetical protein
MPAPPNRYKRKRGSHHSVIGIGADDFRSRRLTADIFRRFVLGVTTELDWLDPGSRVTGSMPPLETTEPNREPPCLFFPREKKFIDKDVQTSHSPLIPHGTAEQPKRQTTTAPR